MDSTELQELCLAWYEAPSVSVCIGLTGAWRPNDNEEVVEELLEIAVRGATSRFSFDKTCVCRRNAAAVAGSARIFSSLLRGPSRP